jgi:hypothetical protein
LTAPEGRCTLTVTSDKFGMASASVVVVVERRTVFLQRGQGRRRVRAPSAVTVADDDRKSKTSAWIEAGKVVAMPLVTLIVGYVLNSSLNYSQTRDSNLRLYADMMGRREEADSALRKDMSSPS